jgi:hypothetical protein
MKLDASFFRILRLGRLGLLFILTMLGAGIACAAADNTTGALIRNETMRATPSAQGKVLTTLGKGSEVTIVGQHGGWVQVTARGKKGWVRLLSVRSGRSAGGNAATELSGLAGLTQKSDNKVVAVAGLRGLNEEDLKEAHFNAEELKKLDSYRVDRQQAEHFAAEGGLVTHDVAYLPAPQTQSNGTTGNREGVVP